MRAHVPVYPRPCGGALIRSSRVIGSGGLSPPVRGSRHGEGQRERHAGSIPARAGEPLARYVPWVLRGVYPRPCGGAVWQGHGITRWSGLSPPVRGSRRGGGDDHQLLRSIPARAGEPPPRVTERPVLAVYPRPCGGATRAGIIMRSLGGLSPPVRGAHLDNVRLVNDRGLSPPVRGSREHIGHEPRQLRSIPARAGEPWYVSIATASAAVYPRPCGGAGIARPFRGVGDGLSPPVRGSPSTVSFMSTPLRSIPARAGEPRPSARGLAGREVYPRPCGGAFLEPRIRTLIQVYPRPCGGAIGRARSTLHEWGLSPPVRGSPWRDAD